MRGIGSPSANRQMYTIITNCVCVCVCVCVGEMIKSGYIVISIKSVMLQILDVQYLIQTLVQSHSHTRTDQETRRPLTTSRYIRIFLARTEYSSTSSARQYSPAAAGYKSQDHGQHHGSTASWAGMSQPQLRVVNTAFSRQYDSPSENTAKVTCPSNATQLISQRNVMMHSTTLIFVLIFHFQISVRCCVYRQIDRQI